MTILQVVRRKWNFLLSIKVAVDLRTLRLSVLSFAKRLKILQQFLTAACRIFVVTSFLICAVYTCPCLLLLILLNDFIVTFCFSDLLDNSVAPPSQDHIYAQWTHRAQPPAPVQLSVFKQPCFGQQHVSALTGVTLTFCYYWLQLKSCSQSRSSNNIICPEYVMSTMQLAMMLTRTQEARLRPGHLRPRPRTYEFKESGQDQGLSLSRTRARLQKNWSLIERLLRHWHNAWTNKPKVSPN